MYQNQALGFSLPRFLRPPQSVGNLFKGIVGSVVKGTTVTVPTPIGPQTFNLGDPAQRAQLEAMVKGTKFNVANPQAGGGFGQAVQQNVPGGWVTIGLVAVAALLLTGGAMGRRSARA